MNEKKTFKIDLHQVNLELVNIDFVLSAIFLKAEYLNIAKNIIITTARKGAQGLPSEAYQELLKEHKLSEYQYYFVLRKLKETGMMRKSGNSYFVSKDLSKLLSRMASRINEFYDQQGVITN